MLKLVVLVIATVFATSVHAEKQSKEIQEQCAQLKSLSQTDLNEMYKQAQPGVVPDGATDGCVIGWPRTIFNLPITHLMNAIWTGKVFNGQTATLKNRVLGHELVSADVYLAESLLDGSTSIIVDYSNEVYPFSMIRDEIREVSPGVYLGREL